MSTRTAVVGVVLTAALAAPTHAIIRRHDRDDARYLELAKGLDAVVVVGGATGTLVAPRWVLTAGHVAESLSPLTRSVEIGGQWFAIDRIVYPPDWKGEPSFESPDLALLRLDKPVSGVKPVPLYEWADEVGKQVLFAGRGMFGTGASGPAGDDGLLRAATNTVSEIPAEGWIAFQFDEPPNGTDLEGISGPGDSGGPALIERDGVRYVAGVSAMNMDHGLGHCRYNTTEVYARVSVALEWLKTTMREGLALPADDVPPAQLVEQSGFPKTPAGRVAEAFFRSYGEGTADSMRAFESNWRAASALASRSVEDRVARWPELREDFGPQDPVAFVSLGPHEIQVVSKGSADWRSFVFRCEEEAPERLTGIYISTAPPFHRAAVSAGD